MISAIIPTCRGAERLARNLPSVIEALAAAAGPWEVLIVNDGGGGLGGLPEGVRTIARPAGGGYGPAVNDGVRAARGDYLLLLNDDVRLLPQTVRTLRACFPDPGLFAVVPRIRSSLARCGDEGGKRGVWQAGLLEIREAPSDSAQPTLYAVGCCVLCPRTLFLELGGYDETFAPFLWEDVDLGYRAWRRGLRLLHVPAAECHHEGSATLSEQRSPAERERIGFRNRVLFHLRNIQDPRMRASQLGAWAAYALFEARPERLEGLAEALDIFAKVGPRGRQGLSDTGILDRIGGA